MNKTIKLAVAGAVLSAASLANAGIIIPAGDWTMDINGNVNIYAMYTDADRASGGAVAGGLAVIRDTTGEGDSYTLGTGLLPAWLGFTGTTRQNDLDVSFTISFQPNTSDNSSAGDGGTPLNRQAFLTFGDKSWGSVKMGKDLGIFASDAILGDMTLLGVGADAGVNGGGTTYGGIGTGYIYPAWKGQIAYTTPNMNGFQATIGILNNTQGLTSAERLFKQDRYGVEGKASYALPNGKIWVSGASYKVTRSATVDSDVTIMDIGTTLNFGNAALTGYYYSGEGAGETLGLLVAGGATDTGAERDQDGGYLQGTYVIPAGTKLGLAYGVSRVDLASGETAGAVEILDENERWTVGAYHPLTKHLNLVAEYNAIESKDHQGDSQESSNISLGAILFF